MTNMILHFEIVFYILRFDNLLNSLQTPWRYILASGNPTVQRYIFFLYKIRAGKGLGAGHKEYPTDYEMITLS